MIIYPRRILDAVTIFCGAAYKKRAIQKLTPTEVTDTCVFMLEHLYHYMFVPGKLENIIVIVDTDKIGITDFPLSVPTFQSLNQN